MENKKFNIVIKSENSSKSNNSIENKQKIETSKRPSKQSINLSLLTTKTDEISDKLTFSEKKINTIINQTSNFEEDSILENLKLKGLLNKTLEYKIEEYKKDLQKSLRKDHNISKFGFIEEVKLIKKNIIFADIELENLLHLKELKEKKIDLLENSIISINAKIKNLNDKINQRSDLNNKEESRIKKNNPKKNWKNILIQHYEIFSYDLLKNLSINQEKNPDKLEKEFTDVCKNQEMDIINLKKQLDIKNIIAYNSNKLQFEKEIKQMKNDHFFIENNLTLEKEALERKKYKKLIKYDKTSEDYHSYYENEIGVICENETYKQRKMESLEKINYLKNLIKNSNANMLTSMNSIVTKKGDFDNKHNLLSQTNETLEDCCIKIDEYNTIIFENNDFLQLNSANHNNKYLIRKQPSNKNVSFEIALSNINSP